ncbi:MAG: MBL fold metallo-hydrolase [Vampirovibrionales bacterium]
MNYSESLPTNTPDCSTQASPYIIESFAVGPLQCNCTLIGHKATGTAVVIDPGGHPDKILKKLEKHQLTLTRILHTHAHFDHFLASGILRTKTQASLALHPQDRFLWDMLPLQCSLFGIELPKSPMPPPDQSLEHEEPLATQWGTDLHGQCVHTPGHTPGSCCFHFPQAQLLVGGDTLFKGSVGRTDLWGGNFKQLENSIQSRLYTLDEATTVIAGHGPSTTIGEELRHNAVVRWG